LRTPARSASRSAQARSAERRGILRIVVAAS
jgi:hypothetical protein